MSSISNTSNSFATILADFIRLQNNSLEQLQKVSQAVTSNADTITVNQQNADGTTSTFTVPSFGFLKSSISRIDNTLNTLMGFDGSDANIRMPDGSFKKIYQAKNVVDPKPVGKVTVPAKFIAENNWFFESLLSPALKVSIDVSQYVPQRESKIFIKRMILSLDTEEKLAFYESDIKGRNDIDYVNFLVSLQRRNITYFVDEEVADLPLSIVRYTGDFVVVNIEDRTFSNPDGSTSTKRWYLFNTLKYNDNLSLSKETMTLKPGDKMMKGESIYEVLEVDNTTNFIRVKRTSGYDPFIIGEPVMLYSETFSPKIANVGIGFNEYTVVFFKSVNDEDNLIATKYSPGVSFFTNELTIDTNDGVKTLKQFYNENVLDFGSNMIAASKENKIAAINGLEPNAPVLDPVNFKVVMINDHKLDQAEVEAIRKKQADKVRLESEITELEKSIDRKKEELNTTKFNSDTERRAVKNQLETLIREKDTKTSLYSSIVKELAVTAQQKPAALDTPKYRIRGFFAIPEPVTDENGNEQNVVQFYVYYRYVRPDGSLSDVKQFDYTDATGAIRRGTYSNLVQVKSDIRKKEYDPITGKYVWADEDIENPDAVNINQVDIPISNGEKVEFFIVSVSEAGWPDNPILSPNSNTITIEFPQDFVTEDEATIALKEASQDVVRVDLENDLAAKGLDVHLSSSFNAIEKYYAHDADVIASNFYTPEGNVISLLEKLQEMTRRIIDLENRLNKVVESVKVFIVDPEKNTKIPIKNGDVVTLFAGYYKDNQALLPTASRRGAIISKTYQIYLENDTASPLELISRLPGGIAENLPVSNASSVPPGINDPDYNNYRKYDITPIVNTSVRDTDTNNANKIASAFYQSGQLKGQFLYSRYKDVGLVNDLYQDAAQRYLVPIDNNAPLPNTSETWVWDTGFPGGIPVGGPPPGGGNLTKFCVHVDHPAIKAPQVILDLDDLQTPTIQVEANRTGGARRITVISGGSGFTNGTFPNVNIVQTGASGGKATVTVFGGAIISPVIVTDPGTGYQLSSSVTFTGIGAGAGLNAIISAVVGDPKSPEEVSAFRHAFGFNQLGDKNLPAKQLSYKNNWNPLGNQNAPGGPTFLTPSINQLPDKFGFTDNDRYLIGSDTCGAYLFLGPVTFNQLLVEGVNALASKTLQPGATNAIVIPIIFQYRMTDYFGPSISGSSIAGGEGILGGYDPSVPVPPKNITYIRQIGLDLYQFDKQTFSFDIQVSATYQRDSLVQLYETGLPNAVKEIKAVTYSKDIIKSIFS